MGRRRGLDRAGIEVAGIVRCGGLGLVRPRRLVGELVVDRVVIGPIGRIGRIGPVGPAGRVARRLVGHERRARVRLGHDLVGLGLDVRARLVIVVVGRLAVDRLPEVTQPGAERAADLGQSLRPQDQQRHHEDEQQMRRLEDVSDHWLEIVPTPWRRVRGWVVNVLISIA